MAFCDPGKYGIKITVKRVQGFKGSRIQASNGI
jgi:hypothetical protein